jgi:VIT1/CCC1 family predicted Fe2+/Mn2+ transporter
MLVLAGIGLTVWASVGTEIERVEKFLAITRALGIFIVAASYFFMLWVIWT